MQGSQVNITYFIRGGDCMDIRILKHYIWLCIHWKEEPTFEGLEEYYYKIKKGD